VEPTANNDDQLRSIPKPFRSGRKLKERDPAKYQRVVEALKDGKSIRHVAVVEDISASSVQTIKFEVAKDLPVFKRRMIGKYAQALDTLADRLIEEAKEAKGVRDISIALGIVHDKLSLAAGEATTITRVEHVDIPDINAVLEGLPSAKPVQIIDVPAEVSANTGQDAGSGNQCSGPSTSSASSGQPGRGGQGREAGNNSMD
jgi:hypothetical protein